MKSKIIIYENGTANVAGFAVYGSNRKETSYPLYDAELISIYVDIKHHRKGIGKKLFDHVISDLANGGCKKMIIWCVKGNSNAQKFYEELGAVPFAEGELDFFGDTLIQIGYSYNL